MKIQGTQQNFGAIVKTKEAERLINRLPYDKAMEIKVMEMDSKHNPVDVYLSTITKNGDDKIKAEVGHKEFVQNFFSGIVKTVRKGFNFANKLNAEQQAERELTKGMTRPTLK